MTIQVFTRSNNDDLYNKMRHLIPMDVDCRKVTRMDEWTQAADYLYGIIDDSQDWVVNCDIDCFIYNWPSVVALVQYCAERGITHAGCRDGGELKGRFHSWTHQNPFFNIFHASKIRELRKDLSWIHIGNTTYNEAWNDQTPLGLPEPVNNDADEPFAGFFYWLYDVGKPLYLKNNLHEDGISTVVEDLAIHTWYSREFNHDTKQHTRITDRFWEAANHSEWLKNNVK